MLKPKPLFPPDMKIKLTAHDPLRKYLDNEPVIHVSGGTIRDVLQWLKMRYPNFTQRLLDERGGVRRFVNIYVNQEDIRFLENQQTTLKDGDEIAIIPATSGG